MFGIFRKRIIQMTLALSVLCIIGNVKPVYAATDKHSEEKKQFNVQNSWFNYDGNETAKIIYDTNLEKEILYYSKSFNQRGNPIAEIGSHGGSVYIKGKYIYYMSISEGKIYRCRKDGSSKKVIANVDVDDYYAKFLISGGTVFYKSNDELSCCSLTGRKHKKIDDGVKSHFYCISDKVFYIKGNRLMKYNKKKGKIVVAKTLAGENELNGVEGNRLYYSMHSNYVGYTPVNVYQFDVRTKKTKKIFSFQTEEPIHDMMVTSKKVYLLTGTGAGDGFGAVQKDGTINYEPYYDKYDCGGELLSFYKNYVVIENINRDTYDYISYVKMEKVK